MVGYLQQMQRCGSILAGVVLALVCAGGCESGGDLVAHWSPAFDTSTAGNLSGVWGSGADDVFIVGGVPGRGEVYHYDGTQWSKAIIPQVPLLVWVYGFGPDDVYAVGEDGGALHFDGENWTVLDTGVADDLWGVWGRSANDIWIVGGDVGIGEPVILHYDGQIFSPSRVPDNDRNATSLFKVWGIGDKAFAVGEAGLIVEWDGDSWEQVLAGADADEDFVSLWGRSPQNIVAVGGRGSARIATYDGTAWATQRFASTPGLNAVFMLASGQCVVGGGNGYVGVFDPATGELSAEESGVNMALHSSWGDGDGRVYAVGGLFAAPHRGVAIVRTLEAATPDDGGSDQPECTRDADCADGYVCETEMCQLAGDAVELHAEIGYVEQSAFVTVPEGGDIYLYVGFQGASHILAALKITGPSPPTDVRLGWTITDAADGTVLSSSSSRLPVVPTEEENVVWVGNQLMQFGVRATALDERDVNITITLTDATTAEGILEVSQGMHLMLREF